MTRKSFPTKQRLWKFVLVEVMVVYTILTLFVDEESLDQDEDDLLKNEDVKES